MRPFLLAIYLMCFALPVQAQLKTEKISDSVYAIVGPLGNRSVGNLGNNATFGLVVTSEGAVLIDAGGTYHGARFLHRQVLKITDQPVRYVINTGGQDHRWLGNSYWIEQGAEVIASEAAVQDQMERAEQQLFVLSELVGDFGVQGTEPVFARRTFNDLLRLTLGGIELELHYLGGAHTPGDIFVWVPSESTVFTGDIVYTKRLLGVIPVSDTVNWLASFEAIEAIDPENIVPGHGGVTDMLSAYTDTYDYLVNLREKIAEHIDAGGDMITSVEVDQTGFEHLENFDQLARRNAQAVYEAMEWE